jgi:hypothetical protein
MARRPAANYRVLITSVRGLLHIMLCSTVTWTAVSRLSNLIYKVVFIVLRAKLPDTLFALKNRYSILVPF